jgi:hypothetical protein
MEPFPLRGVNEAFRFYIESLLHHPVGMGKMSGPKSFHLPRCVVQHMGRLGQARLTPVGVVLLFLISTLMQGYAPTSSSDFIDARADP